MKSDSMGSKRVVGVWVVLVASLVVALVDLPITQSQVSCASGSYTLNGDLTVTGTVKASNVNPGSQQSSFSSCVVTQGTTSTYPFRIVSCPVGKSLTGAECHGVPVTYYSPQYNYYQALPACELKFYKDSTPVSTFPAQVNGVYCSCLSPNNYGTATASIICC